MEYRFQPDDPADGITVVVPKQLISELSAEQFEWLVPGRFEEKIAALIRTLPKSIRRLLVPAPDTARQIVSQLQFGEGPFLKRLAKVLERRAGVAVPTHAISPGGIAQSPANEFSYRGRQRRRACRGT